MKLTYHEGKNFGDALNPLIFHHFLGKDFFDEDSSVQFIGIGSILGLKTQKGKKIVFSSGYAAGDNKTYGAPPVINDDYEIICVRGPKTAQVLKLPQDKAIADGAVLIPKVYMPGVNKRFKCSMILHHKSLEFYNGWKELCDQCGIHLIDARGDVKEVIEEILASELVLCEAMHGAIVADAYRVKWAAVNFYPHINHFKWQDWCESLKMNYAPDNCFHYLHDHDFLTEVVHNKTKMPVLFSKLVALMALNFRKRSVVKFLERMKKAQGQLSDETILHSRQSQLINKLDQLKK
ncbi:MAG: succinoglycan biosynthesis ketolase [Bacteroidota bacterium]|jgi:succinoglycan biosynthesis protein ExoV|nr:succinoglycan biosynthesis ketolase [Bacteroidota bacterium]